MRVCSLDGRMVSHEGYLIGGTLKFKIDSSINERGPLMIVKVISIDGADLTSMVLH